MRRAARAPPWKLAKLALIARPRRRVQGVTSKDIVLHICGVIGTAGGTGATIEFAGSAVRSLSMEGRMSICNMAIEAGARAGLVAPDETTFAYLEGRPMVPDADSAEWAGETRPACTRHQRSVHPPCSRAWP